MRKTTLLIVAAMVLLASTALAAERPNPWPRTFRTNDATFVLYQPQLVEWTGGI